MAEENSTKKKLTDIILDDKKVGPLGRIVSAPFFRSEDKRIGDLASVILEDKDNGIGEYLNEISKRDLKVGKQVYNEAFVDGYAGQLIEVYRPAVRVAEANDTYDKFAALAEAGLDATIVGIPLSTIHRIISTVGPVAALATLGRYAYKNTKDDPDSKTRNDSRNRFWTWAAVLGLVEAAEFVPGISEVANLAVDPIDLYVVAANQTISKTTSRKKFEDYFQKNFPELYSRAMGGPIIDVKAKDSPAAPRHLEEYVEGEMPDGSYRNPITQIEPRYQPPGGYRRFS